MQLKIAKTFINAVLISTLTVLINGCTLVQAGFESQAEVPSLENQVNRIVIAMGLIRTNSVIENMPISADALWPDELSDPLVLEDNKEIIKRALADDPYVATHAYTDLYQKKMLKGITWLPVPHIDLLTYHALNRAIILYGPKEEDWPSFFEIETDLSHFHTFKDGNLKQVEAASADVYANLSDAIISLMPINFQKDLIQAEKEMRDAFFEVLQYKAEKARYEKDIRDQNSGYENIYELKRQVLILEKKISEAEMRADEKEKIYFILLDEASEELKNDIRLDEEQVKLAENIILASEAIKRGATEAGLAFSLSLTNITVRKVMENFKEELKTLAIAKIYVPRDKQDLYNKRVVRISTSALSAIPAIGIGSYYAVKQAIVAEKYETVAEIIVEAKGLQKTQEDVDIQERKKVKEEVENPSIKEDI